MLHVQALFFSLYALGYKPQVFIQIAKQTALSAGGFCLPPAKRRPTNPDHNEGCSNSMRHGRKLYPGLKQMRVLKVNLLYTWLQLVNNPVDGMVCLLCTKYKKESKSG